jgi:hypothetical protein
MSGGHICNICERTFANISSLNYHKKTAKYCIKLQHKNICLFCEKEFATKQNLQNHLLICKEKQSREQKSIYEEKEHYKFSTILLENKVKELQEKLDDLKKEFDDYKQNSIPTSDVTCSTVGELLSNIKVIIPIEHK